jgi:shikimate dehydrogenase
VSVRGMDPAKESPLKPDRSTLLINSTPLGMKENDALPFPSAWIDPDWIVADLIYRPDETPLLSAAKKAGAKTISGAGMLLHQGALAFEIWTKEKAPLHVMRESLRNALAPGNSPPHSL